jgi:hypothetical protein
MKTTYATPRVITNCSVVRDTLTPGNPGVEGIVQPLTAGRVGYDL